MKLFTIETDNSEQHVSDKTLNEIGSMLSGMKQTHTEASASDVWGFE